MFITGVVFGAAVVFGVAFVLLQTVKRVLEVRELEIRQRQTEILQWHVTNGSTEPWSPRLDRLRRQIGR